MAAAKQDYELLDFGEGRKLERFGNYILDRPEILATQNKTLSPQVWANAHGKFQTQGKQKVKGKWQFNQQVESHWNCTFSASKISWNCILKFGEFKHVGVFPEQQSHWGFIGKHIKPGDKFLNLFAYTGCASLAAAKAGADVFHVDSSKSVVKWAAENAEASNLDNLHWVCEDALRFAKREVKRGKKYAGIIMDPPVYGRGKKGEHWRLEDLLPDLVDTTKQLLTPNGFAILNTYSPSVDIPMMMGICKKHGLHGIKMGWLSVENKQGKKLNLSKFIIVKPSRGA